MNQTLEQLRQEWPSPCPTLTAIRERYFSHIRTDKHLLRLINSGKVALKVNRLHNSARAKRVVYLHDLADYLDAQALAET
ncbi:pyocin activator PrtN family protein [Pseudomonas sp. LFM046]|uniref:pyocin activator PrtN family protein n=1 Tax=Pseudomonas sp. LFM046 TaxID=1608357 RepID=UPI0005CFC159|nr:pyocin activator PrtN family protein [Pseudomonas sp. LFM046]